MKNAPTHDCTKKDQCQLTWAKRHGYELRVEKGPTTGNNVYAQFKFD